MSETESTEQPLPDPAALHAAQQAFDHADHAASQARRILAASTMEPLLGCAAGAISATGSALLLMDQASKWSGLIWGNVAEWSFVIWGGWILYSMRHRRKTDACFAVHWTAADRTRRLNWNLPIAIAFVTGMLYFWQWAFLRMPVDAIVLVIGASMAAFAGVFVTRFCALRLAEDLVFAAAIAIPWALYLARIPNTAVAGMLATLSAFGAIWSLRRRWKHFTRTGHGSALPETPVPPA